MKSNHITRQVIHENAFGITIPKVTREVGTPEEELKKIIDLLPGNITVLCSGGADSEVFAKFLVKHGKRVKAVCYRIFHGDRFVNQHDVEWVKELDGFCEIVYKDFDIKAFWESDFFWDFIKTYKCTSPQLPFHAYITELESKEQFTVLTSVHPEPKHFHEITWIQEREKDYAVVDYLANNKNCLVSPLRSNSEILAALLSSKEFSEFKNYGLVDGRDRKPQQYFDWFGIEIKPRPKYHGFEGSEDLDNGMRLEIWKKTFYTEIHLYIPVEEMLENLFLKDAVYTTRTHKKIWYRECHMVGRAGG